MLHCTSPLTVTARRDRQLPAHAEQQMALEDAAFDEQGVDVAGGAPVIEWRSERQPAPAARNDAQVLQPRIAVAFSACGEREALVDGRFLVTTVAHVWARIEQRGRAAIRPHGTRCEERKKERVTE